MYAFSTHISLAAFYRTYAISADPDQTPQNAAFGHGFHCLLTVCAIKIRIIIDKTTQLP